MQFATITTVLCLTLLTIEVLGGAAPIFKFNNGIVQDGMDCPGNEWALVKETMANATHQRRAVRRLGGGGIDHHHRELSHKCSRCGTLCAFVGHGCARSGSGAMDAERRDRRQLTDQCATDSAAINASLAALMPRLSPKCQALLSAPRNVTCVQTTLSCHIDSISLWDDLTRKLVLSNFSTTNVTTFCRGWLPMTFRADTNYTLGTVSFAMTGPGGLTVNRTSSLSPYFMHESVETSALSSYTPPGMTLTPGNYTLSVSAGGDSSFKTYRFRVNNCYY